MMDFEKFFVIPQISYDPTENELWASTVLSFFGAYLSTIDTDHRPWFMATSVATNLIALPLSNWLRTVYDIPWYILYYNLAGIGINITYNLISNKSLLKFDGLTMLLVGSVINTFLIGGMQYARSLVEEGEKIVMRDARILLSEGVSEGQQAIDLEEKRFIADARGVVNEGLDRGERIISSYEVVQGGSLYNNTATFTAKKKT